jgi:peroxiredoxin
VAISRQEVAAGAISVGASLPEFTATDDRGETFAFRAESGRPVLLKFFRGHW